MTIRARPSSTRIDRFLLHAALGAAGLLAMRSAFAADLALMTNVADNALWSVGANWQDGVAPGNGDGLVFGTNVNLAALTVTNDLASLTSGPITFGADAVSYTLAGNAMTLGGDITSLAPAVQTLALDLVLNANRGIHAAGGLTIAGAVSGGFGLMKTGGDILTLSGANTYTGTTELNEGVVVAGVADVAGVSGALGNGGDLTFTGGTLRYSAASAGTDYSTRFKNSASAIVLDTDGQTVTLAGVIDASNTGGLTKTGAGTLRLIGAADNTFGGKTLVSGGTLVITNTAANPLGAAPGAFVADQLELRDGTLLISYSREFEATRGLTLSGTSNTLSFGPGAVLKLNAPITGVATTSLTKLTGSTELWLHADSSPTFNGTFYVSGGSTRAAHDGALGSGTIYFGANARLSSTGDTARVFTNDVAISVGGAANNNAAILGQTTVYTGALTFLGPVTLKATAAGTTRSISAEAPAFLAGTIAEEQPDTTFKKIGASTLTILNTASYSGSTILSNGVLRVMEAGELTATTNILVADGRTLVLGATDEAVSKNSRVNDASTLSFGGTSRLNLSAAANVNEAVGAISLSGREVPVFTLDTAAGAQADLTVASLARVDPGQSLLVRGTNLGAAPGAGTTHIFLTAPPALTGGGGSGPQVSIVPWILGSQGTSGSGSDLVTYDATRGLRPLDATEYDAVVAGASPTRNVSLAGAETLAADQTVNALRLAGGALTNAPGGTLTVASGAILAYDADAGIARGRLEFGAAEGAFHLIDEGADQARTVTVAAALSGTGGLSLNANQANSVLYLTESSLVTGVAAFAGSVAVNGGQIRMGAANVLYGTPLTLNAGTKVVLNGFSQTIGDLSGAGNIEDGSSSGTPVLTVHQAANGTYSGVIATSGDRTIALTKIGNGVLTLTANQNLNGDVRIERGGLTLSGGGQLDDPNNFYISGGGALRLVNTSADLDNTRLKTGATIFMSGGIYSSGHDNGSVSPSVVQTTPLMLLAGANMVSNRQAASGQTSTLGFGSLSRSAGATVDFQGGGLGGNTRNRIAFTTTPTLDDGIIGGWAYVGNDFATYDATVGSVTALAAYATTAESAWLATDNVRHSMAVASTTTLTGNRTVNTLNLVVTGTAGTDPIFALAANTLTLDAGGLILSGTDSVTLSATTGGALTVGPGADSLYELAARIASGRTLTITAPIVDNGANAVSLVKSGSGTLQLNTANNTFSGPVYVDEGALIIQNAAAIDADNAVILNGGVLRLRAATTVKSLAGDETGVVRTYDDTARTLNISGTSGTAVFAGTISNQLNALTLNKNGASIQVLAGSNAYTGVTTVNGGLLQFGRRVSLYGADPASWTTAKLDVNAGAALGFNVGGPGEFTAADLDLLLALGTASAGFNSGSFAGLDTTSGDFEYGGVIANPNGGANALGLVKLGANTLILPGANTYSGGTLISGGALQVGNGGTSGTLGSGAVSNDADLVFNRSDAFAFANAMSGSGTLTMRGTGELTLSSASSYTGGTRIQNGTVVVGAAGALGTGGLTMGGSGTAAGALALSTPARRWRLCRSPRRTRSRTGSTSAPGRRSPCWGSSPTDSM